MVVVFCGCIGLGWWQWERFSESSGTAQNLGYALQWPLFALVSVYAYRKFVRLEEQQQDDTIEVAGGEQDPEEIPADLLPARPTAAAPVHEGALSDYNAYLADLAAQDRQAATDRDSTRSS